MESWASNSPKARNTLKGRRGSSPTNASCPARSSASKARTSTLPPPRIRASAAMRSRSAISRPARMRSAPDSAAARAKARATDEPAPSPRQSGRSLTARLPRCRGRARAGTGLQQGAQGLAAGRFRQQALELVKAASAIKAVPAGDGIKWIEEAIIAASPCLAEGRDPPPVGGVEQGDAERIEHQA